MENEELMNEELSEKSKFRLWLENFWYHYKLHTIAALFAIMVIAVFIFQICTRPVYDIYIMYAGGKPFPHNTSDNDTYSNILTSLQRVAIDYDADGEAKANFSTFYIPSKDELEQLKNDGMADALAPTIKSDTDSLNTNMMLSEFYICLFSEELFLAKDKNQRPSDSDPVYPFADLSSYTDKDKEGSYRYVDGSTRGIYLSSTDFYKMAGFCELPEDTVIAFRIRSTVYSSDRDIEYYESCEQVLRNMLSYTPIG